MKMLKHFPKLVLGLSALSLVAMGQLSRADAASVTFSGTGTNSGFTSSTGSSLGSTLVFDDLLNPGKLTVKITNTGAGAKAPSDILTSVFWDYDGSPLNLLLESATAGTVTKYNGSTLNSTSNVNLLNTPDNGQEWSFASSSSGLGGNTSNGGTGVTQQYGLGTAGLGIFQNIGGSTQQAYGIINGYSSTANSPVKTNPLVNNSATFVFSSLPSSFDIGKIKNVRFQYGTALNEARITNGITVNYSGYTPPSQPPATGGDTSSTPRKVPEPTTTLALGIVAISALKLRKGNSVVQA